MGAIIMHGVLQWLCVVIIMFSVGYRASSSESDARVLICSILIVIAFLLFGIHHDIRLLVNSGGLS